MAASNNFFYLMLALLLPIAIKAQNKIYTEVYNYNTKLAPADMSPDQTISCYHEGIVYFVKHRAAFDTDVLVIGEYNTKNQKTKFIEIKKNKDSKKLFNEHIDAIAVTNNKLVIINYLHIFIFTKTNHDYMLQKTIRNDGSFNDIYPLTDTELLLYVNYAFHPIDESNPHSWARLFMDRDSLGAETHMGDENLLFSYFPNQWISAYKGLIAYAHTTDYSIRFYDQQFYPIDSIISPRLDQNKNSLRLVPDDSDFSVDKMNKIGAADDSLLTRIQKIFLLDSTHLLATLKQPKTHYLRYELWQKDKAGWQLHKSQELPGHYENGKKYTAENNDIEGFYGNYSGLVYAGNNEFYFIDYPFMENPVSEFFDFQKDYYDKVNELTRKKELYYGIKKLKILRD
jgi:hypothetical protein